MAADEWTPGEDFRRGVQMFRVQPEVTPRGRVWTQLIWFTLDDKKYHTQLIVRDCSDEYLISHGRIYPVADEDGA
jgi:hypothetical protein